MKSLRLFVALELPSDWRRALAELSARLRGRLPAARWVKADRMHLTLAFFAAVEETRVRPLEGAVGRVCSRFAPISMRLDGAGVFPSSGRARVAWLSVEASPPLDGLANGIRDEISAATGLPREERAFRSHLTLARCRPFWDREAVARFRAAVPVGLVAPFVSRQVAVIESRLGHEGPRYRTLSRSPLGTPS